MSTNASKQTITRVRNHLKRITGYELRDDKHLHDIIDYRGAYRPSDGRRLAMMGDMALQMAVLHNWYSSGRPVSEAAGLLDYMASNRRLAHVGGALEVDKYLLRGERIKMSKVHIATAVEAYLGAIYLDSGRDLGAITAAVKKMGLHQQSPPESAGVPKSEATVEDQDDVEDTIEHDDPTEQQGPFEGSGAPGLNEVPEKHGLAQENAASMENDAPENKMAQTMSSERTSLPHECFRRTFGFDTGLLSEQKSPSEKNDAPEEIDSHEEIDSFEEKAALQKHDPPAENEVREENEPPRRTGSQRTHIRRARKRRAIQRERAALGELVFLRSSRSTLAFKSPLEKDDSAETIVPSRTYDPPEENDLPRNNELDANVFRKPILESAVVRSVWVAQSLHIPQEPSKGQMQVDQEDLSGEDESFGQKEVPERDEATTQHHSSEQSNTFAESASLDGKETP